MFFIVIIYALLLYASNGETIWERYDGSTTGWSITMDGSSDTIISTATNDVCDPAPCLKIQSGSGSWKYAYVTRTIEPSTKDYNSLRINFNYFCNYGVGTTQTRSCYFEYWCQGISTQHLPILTGSSFSRSLTLCDGKDLTIRFGTTGGNIDVNQKKGRLWVDNIIVTGSKITLQPTSPPSSHPSLHPTLITSHPSIHPTLVTTQPSSQPTESPSENPTLQPTAVTSSPTSNPTVLPTPVPTSCRTAITGISAIATSGKPHFRLWNGAKHTFSGRPDKGQYYYMHPCVAVNRSEMPFALLGTHKKHKGSSSLWYIVLELYDNDDELYLVWFNTQISSWALWQNDGSIYTFYERNFNHDVFEEEHTFESDTIESIGNLFKVSYTVINETTGDTSFTLTVGNDCTLNLIMTRIDDIDSEKHDIQVFTPECYRCFTCGLFGDFNTPEDVNEIQQCDGTIYEFNKDDNTFDPNGWGWERTYVTDACHWNRRLLNENEDESYNIVLEDNINSTYMDPCNDTIAQSVIDECELARYDSNILECCDSIIGGKFCNTDACILADGDQMLITAFVYQVFTKIVYLVCDIPNIGEEEDENNLIWAPYETSSPTTIPTLMSIDDDTDTDKDSSPRRYILNDFLPIVIYITLFYCML